MPAKATERSSSVRLGSSKKMGEHHAIEGLVSCSKGG